MCVCVNLQRMAVFPEAHGGMAQGSMAATTASLKTEQASLRVAKQDTLLRIQYLQNQHKKYVMLPPPSLFRGTHTTNEVNSLVQSRKGVTLMGVALHSRSCVRRHVVKVKVSSSVVSCTSFYWVACTECNILIECSPMAAGLVERGAR